MKTNVIPVPSTLEPGAQTAQWVLDQITTFPETHDQHTYVSPCGTQHCVAGWAMYVHCRVNQEELPSWKEALPWRFGGQNALQLSDLDAFHLFAAALQPEVAVKALKMLANGERINWSEISG